MIIYHTYQYECWQILALGIGNWALGIGHWALEMELLVA
jgi:hypothetical protein